jgi:hypothetical protein
MLTCTNDHGQLRGATEEAQVERSQNPQVLGSESEGAHSSEISLSRGFSC